MARLSIFLPILALFSFLVSGSPLIKRAALTQVTNSGISNPTNVGFYIYVPDKLATSPAIVVAVHYCTGTAQAYYSGSPYKTLADQYGFIVIYPSSPWSGTCWDVSSKATLTHNGGGDSNAIANMVKWTITKYNANANAVYVTGSSSGAMMTNVLCATYPDIFKAATAYSGVAAGCFYSQAGGQAAWNSSCASGTSIWTQDQWRNTALAMYPGYAGDRPGIQLYHGTADTTILPQNLVEAEKQWTGVFGYSMTPASTQSNSPLSGSTRSIFGPKVQGILGQGVGHTYPIQGAEDMKWFGIPGGSTPPPPVSSAAPPPASSARPATSSIRPTTTVTPPRSSSVVVVPPPATSSPAPGGCTAAKYAQCGGNGFTGCKTCAAGSTCKYSNDWYSQCL